MKQMGAFMNEIFLADTGEVHEQSEAVAPVDKLGSGILNKGFDRGSTTRTCAS